LLPLSVNASGGMPGVTVPQGARATLYSDTVNVWYANGAFSIPTGTVADFAGATAPPGWLLCFGQSVLRAQYPTLFNAISTTYGSVDGSHFNIRDCRGRILAGVDNMGGSAANRITSGRSGINGVSLGASGGNELLQSHSHANS
jgi:Phage Tail Collar Domain